MSDKWILSVQTSLPNYCKNKKDIIRNDQVFDSFEEGKAAFIETLKSYSFSENAMFDGNGRCKEFEDFFGTSSGNWDWLIEADPAGYQYISEHPTKFAQVQQSQFHTAKSKKASTT